MTRIYVIPKYHCKHCGMTFSTEENRHPLPFTCEGREHLEHYGNIPIKPQGSGPEDMDKWAIVEYTPLLHICDAHHYGIADLVGYEVYTEGTEDCDEEN